MSLQYPENPFLLISAPCCAEEIGIYLHFIMRTRASDRVKVLTLGGVPPHTHERTRVQRKLLHGDRAERAGCRGDCKQS